MRISRRGLALVAALWLSAGTVLHAELPEIRVGVLQNGTVMWELDTIIAEGLDGQNGFRLNVMPLAGNPATQIAMQGGEVDTIVSDWIWVARQRGRGADFTFLPYSTAVGGLVVPADSAVTSLADLEGQKIGIAGGPLDKSWLILRAWYLDRTGTDLAQVTQQVFGAPPVIQNAAERGEVAGAINFWHFLAKMQAGGMRQIISISDAATDLGLDPQLPLLGYVLRDKWIAAHPDLAQGLARASRQAKDVLRRDQAAWGRLRDRMNAADEAEFQALRAGWLAGIPPAGPVDADNAARLFSVMAELGGQDLTGGLTELPLGLFWSGE